MISRRTLLGATAATAATAGLVLAGPAVAAGRRRPSSTWDRLDNALAGDLVLPGDPGYDQARQLENAQFDTVFPQAVVYAENAADVRTAIRFAQDEGLPTAVRSGGHSYAGWSTSEGLVINLTRLNKVAVKGGTVSLQPAVQAVDVPGQLAPRGLSVPAGFCATVSPGGFVSGGGTGWQYRKYGPACDRLVGAEVVLADGRIVNVSKDCHPDLLWALRGGGGGNFGVVTEFRMAPTQVGRVGHYTLTWDWAHAQQAVAGYLQWTTEASPDLSSDGVLLLPDASPGAAPSFLVTGVDLAGIDALKQELAHLTALIGVPPATQVVQDLSYPDALMQVFGCGSLTVDACHTTGANPHASLPRQAYVKNRGRMFTRVLPADGIDRLLTAFDADRRAGQTRVVSLLGLGKNANNRSLDYGAWPHRDSLYSAIATVSLANWNPPAEEREAAQDWIDGVFDAFDPYSNGRSYLNFPDTRLTDYADAYWGPNLSRLSRVKRAYDPHDFFHYAQSVPLG
ncbi:FAD-binding oxidoreductase [Kitasatospora sp. NBC_01250]|uniref:FAD-binding oxidoreductase n=1 Tax=Kitasatospora sp. NBC_01250 TaxID=2903571 RepID=UPI002E30F8B2|nr:FAD-binding oxidoreductase [Kitasatospora sp. NBC_01250]